jgi:hypothetical protein
LEQLETKEKRMTKEEIIELAGHRQVPAWVMKLVSDAIARELEACAKLCETLWNTPDNGMATEEKCYGDQCAEAIRARGEA